VLLAVDAQPDGTVARKRFWRGNFLFAQDPTLGSPGFKRFRPIIREKNGVLRRLTNDEIRTLALKDVLDRAADLEMGYNLNDCVELRWGAAQESEEASTCKRHASSAQRARMMEYRTWFHERRRPPSA
jgi:hypothetical protein